MIILKNFTYWLLNTVILTNLSVSEIWPDKRVWFGLWCLMPLSTIFQLYRGATVRFICWENHRPVTSHWQALSHKGGKEYTLPLVVIGTNCIGSFKSNYHIITTTMTCWWEGSYQHVTSVFIDLHVIINFSSSCIFQNSENYIWMNY